MKENADAHKQISDEVLVEADFFISYLTEDSLEEYFRVAVELAYKGFTEFLVCSEVYDDVISALRSQGVGLKEVQDFISDMKIIPHKTVAVTASVASEALSLYREFGGSRKLHYFDSFHVATAKNAQLPLLTSDKFIIRNATRLGIKALDVRNLR